MTRGLKMTLLSLSLLGLLACDDGDGGSEADRLGVGAACVEDADCVEEGQSCLLEFKGGYCGVADCQGDVDCPAGSLCVVHDTGANYCFLTCGSKPECNTHRGPDDEANCSGSAVFLEENDGSKACIPPSSGS